LHFEAASAQPVRFKTLMVSAACALHDARRANSRNEAPPRLIKQLGPNGYVDV